MFKSYRVVHRIHLGGIDQVLEVDDIGWFDGSTLKTSGEKEIKLTQPSAIVGAIKVGWLVPSGDEKSGYTPKSAGVQVHSAKSTGETRAKVKVMTVQEEDRNVGTRREVRGQKDSSGSSQNASEGVVIARLKTSAKSGPIEIGKDDRTVISKIENSSLAVEKVKTASSFSGDVEEALTGDDLEDILPNAVSSSKPKPGVYAEEVEVEEISSPDSSSGSEGHLRRMVKVGKTPTGQTFPKDAAKMVLSVLGELDLVRERETLLREELAELREKLASSSTPVKPTPKTAKPKKEEFVWDMTQHWKTRHAAVQQYRNNPTILRKIYEIENSGGVKKLIESILGEV